MKQTQNEPKSALENHQKNPAKNQMVMRCKIILLKQAIQRAELAILKKIGSTPLSNIEAAIGYTSDAGIKTVIALNDGFMSAEMIFQISTALSNAACLINIPEVLEAWILAMNVEVLMPLPDGKRGVPMYNIKNYPVGGAK